jgi:hypothetical protein
VRAIGHEETDWKNFQTFITCFWRAQILAQSEPAAVQRLPLRVIAEPDDAWEALLQLDGTQALLKGRLYPACADLAPSPHAAESHDEDMCRSVTQALHGDLRNSFADVLGALHSVFEDLMLDQMLWRWLPCLAALLATLAHNLGLQLWKVGPRPARLHVPSYPH